MRNKCHKKSIKSIYESNMKAACPIANLSSSSFMIFLLLLINIISLSLQEVQAIFFCDNNLNGISLIENGIEKNISGPVNSDGEFIYPCLNLSAVPGDLIKLNCFNEGGHAGCSGCFLMYGVCYCYNFNVIGGDHQLSSRKPLNFNFGTKSCTFTPDHFSSGQSDYFYIE